MHYVCRSLLMSVPGQIECDGLTPVLGRFQKKEGRRERRNEGWCVGGEGREGWGEGMGGRDGAE